MKTVFWLKRSIATGMFILGISFLAYIAYFAFLVPQKERIASILLLPLLICYLIIPRAWRAMRYQGLGIDDVSNPYMNTPEIKESRLEAQKRLPEFIREVTQGNTNCYIKYSLEHDGQREDVWAYVHAYQPGFFAVSIVSDMAGSDELKSHQTLVEEDNILDWQIRQPDDRMRGTFSTIGHFRYYEKNHGWLTPRMRQQKALLVDY